MKTAVILAGGKGLRLQPNTEELPKPMLLINDKPILEYIILLLKDVGFRELYVVVGYRKELITEYFKDGSKFGLRIEYIENKYINDPHRRGLSDAILLAKDYVKESFMSILGDEIYVNTKHKEMVQTFEKSKDCEALIAVYETENIDDVKKNYSVKIENTKTWHILDLEEKPSQPWNNLVGCGTYLFHPSIFSYIENTPLSKRNGRKEIADTLKLMVLDNKIVRAFSIGGRYININYAEDLSLAKRVISKVS